MKQLIEVALDDSTRMAIAIDDIRAVWDDAPNDRSIVHCSLGPVTIDEPYDGFIERLTQLQEAAYGGGIIAPVDVPVPAATPKGRRSA